MKLQAQQNDGTRHAGVPCSDDNCPTVFVAKSPIAYPAMLSWCFDKQILQAHL